MKTGITPAVTHKKSWKKIFFLLVEMVQNFMGTIFRTKITTKNFFMTQSQKFVILSRKKKKVSKFSEKWQKMPKFLKFKCGFLAEIGRYLAGKWPIESGLPKILAKIFFITKSQKFVILSRKVDPPPPRFSRKTGGGFVSYIRLIPDIIWAVDH